MAFPEGCDVATGDVVTLTDGTTTLMHTVQNLTVTEVNEVANTVAGTADGGAQVHVWPHGHDEVLVTAGEDGVWTAAVSADLVGGMCGRSEIRDVNGNATAVDWCVPNTRMTVFLDRPYIEGYEWPDGATVSVTVAGKDVCASSAQSAYPEWDPQHTFMSIDLPEGCDVAPGDAVAMSDGTLTIFHTVQNVAVTSVDVSEDTVAGTADVGAIVDVWIHGLDGSEMQLTADDGNWRADFGSMEISLEDGVCGRAEIRVGANATGYDWCVGARPRLQVGNFEVEWSSDNPEEIVGLRWRGSANLTNPWAHPDCAGDLEFFGNGWVSENEGTEDFFFASLVGWGSTGARTIQSSTEVDIDSQSSLCPGSAEIPVTTHYRFFGDELRANLIEVRRTFDFGPDAYTHNVRPFIPRLFPADGFTRVLHPGAEGALLVEETTCGFGCMITDWNGTWFAIHNPTTGQGMLVQRGAPAYPAALWLDEDGGSFTNASSVLLLQPDGGFTGIVEETEFLCFYGDNWTPSLTLPPGCEP